MNFVAWLDSCRACGRHGYVLSRTLVRNGSDHIFRDHFWSARHFHLTSPISMFSCHVCHVRSWVHFLELTQHPLLGELPCLWAAHWRFNPFPETMTSSQRRIVKDVRGGGGIQKHG